MAFGYWKSQTHNKHTVFHLFFRKQPFSGGYTVACGLQPVIDVLKNFRFDDEDIVYLRSLCGNDERPLFDDAFLKYLSELEFSCDVDAVPEGTVVFPHEPLVRVSGPIIECQILETVLLNIVNFQTLVATKAARICDAARGDAVLEFGLRRAQGIDGGLAASRAAYIGGCAATSNVLAGKRFGIPVKGTHAHSWVMSFDDEVEAFDRYADAMPNNCVFLVDTYDTLEGVRRATQVGKRLRQAGHEMVGIRLDSGDLADLSIQARRILDDADFTKAAIVASNDLDEYLIENLRNQGAKISVWGVGTRLATSYDQPALGGVYKLAAVRSPGEEWSPRIKLSEQAVKVSNPGILQVKRYEEAGQFVCDCIYDTLTGLLSDSMVSTSDATRGYTIPQDAIGSDVLVPVFRDGRCVYQQPTIHDSRTRTQCQLEKLGSQTRRFLNPQEYPVGLAQSLHDLKIRLRAAAGKGC